jgi:hypothetical protein
MTILQYTTKHSRPSHTQCHSDVMYSARMKVDKDVMVKIEFSTRY